jgi:hypothetical protein
MTDILDRLDHTIVHGTNGWTIDVLRDSVSEIARLRVINTELNHQVQANHMTKRWRDLALVLADVMFQIFDHKAMSTKGFHEYLSDLMMATGMVTRWLGEGETIKGEAVKACERLKAYQESKDEKS